MTARNKTARATIAVAMAVVTAAVAWAALGGSTARAEGPTRFAASMPRGALVYLEARDLHGLMGRWLGSETRRRYFESASYRSFTRSKLYLKLKGRLADLEGGFGFAITEERLASLAGGPSAVAVYDPGKLEILLVTEVPRQQAEVAALLAAASGFEERRTAKGTPMRVRQVTTDGGRLAQQVAFAYVDGRLWLTTSAALLAEALDGPREGGLAAQVAVTAKAAAGFEPHDVVIWIDQEKANRNKYFDLYWVQRNRADLASISSGILDIELAADGVRERRWFVTTEPPAGGGSDGAALATLEALAPADAQLVEARVADGGLGRALAETFFGPERRGDALVETSRIRDSVLDEEEDEDRQPAVRYARLDDRFLADVDDPAKAHAAPALATSSRPGFAAELVTLLAPAAPARYATYAGIDLPEGRLFADFRSGAIVELGSPDRLDTRALEALVSAEFGRRFVVGGDASKAAWVGEGGARAVAGSLVEQGGAYRVAGRYLIVTRTAAEAAAIAERAGRATGAAPAGVIRVAEVRIGAARDDFARFTRVLDAKAAAALAEEVSSSEDEEEGAADPSTRRRVLFFSENVASLLDVARELDLVRVTTWREGALLREQVEYLWATK